MFATKLSLAVALLAVSATAQDITSAVSTYLNPSLSDACKSAVTLGLVQGASNCGLLSLLPIIQNGTSNSTDPYSTVNSVLSSDSFLPALCGSSCSSTITSLNSTLPAACGDSALLNPSLFNSTTDSVNSTSIMNQLTAQVLLNGLSFATKVGCFQDGTTYCLKEQFSQFEKDFPNATNVTTDALLQDKNLVCTSCTARELQAWNSNIGLLPANYSSQYASTSAALTNATSTCPAGSLTTNSSSSKNSAWSKAAPGLTFSAAVAAAAALVMA